MAASAKAHFGRSFFQFFQELAVHNSRPWFEAHKDRFEAEVREPLLAFVRDFAKPLQKISPHFVADARKAGGSVFRIHRDIRFSKDKSPYKTYAGIQFRHVRGKDVHAPGFYLHLQPGNVFAGMGLWKPEPDDLQRLRMSIAEDPKRWGRIVGAKKFKELLSLGGDQLKRMPRGFDPEHPRADDLRRKDFFVLHNFKDRDVTQADFFQRYTEVCRAAAPFGKFVTETIGLRF